MTITTDNQDKVLYGPEKSKSEILEILESDKAEEICVIDLKGKTSIADYMVIANGRSSRHVSSMAGHLYNKIRPHVPDFHIEGEDKGDWVLVDTGDVVIHLFRPEVREFYRIEKLWTDPQSWMSAKAPTDEMEEHPIPAS